MNKIICFILFFIAGVLIYQILKNSCKCEEGFGIFGRANLEKCCPMGYMYSDTLKKCVKICDGCTMESYGNMKLHMGLGTRSGAPGTELIAYYDCSENDSKDIYNYDKINRRYKKKDLLDQYDYGFGDEVEKGKEGEVQASEEGENEAWAGISTDAASGHSGVWHETSSAQGPFQEVPTGHYYTGSDECNDDYSNFIDMFPNRNKLPQEKPDDCRGHWKLEMRDERFDYIKDNTELYFPPAWEIDPTDTERSEGVSRDKYHKTNIETINNIIDNQTSDNSPVRKIYEDFKIEYDSTSAKALSDEKENTNNLLKENRHDFCTVFNVLINEGLFSDNTTDIKNKSIIGNSDIKYNNLCPESTNMDDYINNTFWKTLCDSDFNSISIPFKKSENFIDNNYLCVSQTHDKHLCPISDGTDLDTNKTFCS